MLGRGAGKDGFIAYTSMCLISPYNPVKYYDVDICAINEEQAMRPVTDFVEGLEDAENENYAISGGFFQFDKNKSLLLTDAIEGRGEIDLERAQKAYQRAKERLEKKDSDTNMRRAELALKRAIARMNVHGR